MRKIHIQSKTMKIISVVGARPQFIKLAALSKELRKKHQEIILHTGQHYDDDLSSVFFSELSIPKPDYNLGIGSAEHGEQTGRMLEGIERILLSQKPNLVIVYGDTNSTLAGALAAAKLNIPVAHVEAGLRSYRKSIPEEINRILTDHVSTLLFCPTPTSVKNLEKEGITKGVHLVGDVMYDSLQDHLKLAEKKSRILKKLNLRKKEFYLLTIHRADNTDIRENLLKVTQIIAKLDQKVVFPIHPRTKKKLTEFRLLNRLLSLSNLILIDPASYVDMLILEKNARFVLTDSGGVQKEAYFLRTPCLTLRNETEWVETVESGWNSITGLEFEKIKQSLNREITPSKSRRALLGSAKASQNISKVLSAKLKA